MTCFLIKTESVYAAILDETSSINVHGFMERELIASAEVTRKQVPPNDEGLFYFNGKLCEYAHQGHMMAWTFLFHGVYQADVKISTFPANAKNDLPAIENVGHQIMQADLLCRSGKFLITGLYELGKSDQNIVTVDPGVYRVTLERNNDMEAKHEFLEEIKAYPTGDAADWRITIQSIKAIQS